MSSEDGLRFGGPAGEEPEEPVAKGDDSELKAKQEDRERKKAEVRKRLEESGKSAKKAKKGFLTPERKKKLRKLLMSKAAEDLKQQQLKREQERQKVLSSRIPSTPDVDGIEDKGQLEKIYQDLFQKMIKLEEEKYDINFVVSQKDAEINELSIAVNDLRGKFVKPSLKKVSKYDNKFRKLTEGSAATGGGEGPKKDFRAQLKVVKKENVIEEIVAKTKKSDKPEWSKKGGAGEAPVPAPKRGSVASSTGASSKPEPEPVATEEPVAEEPVEEEEGEEIDEEEAEEEEE
jgi:hypothetical protein